MLNGSTGFYDVCTLILDAVKAELAAPGATGVPGRACIVPGAIAWDDCECDGGQLAVAVQRQFFSEVIPQEVGEILGVGGCPSPYLTAEIVVQIIRCAPQPEEQALSPTCRALDQSAQVVVRDAWYVLKATACTLAAEVDEKIAGYLVTEQPIVGPEGACVGSELHVLVTLEWN